MWKEKTDKRQGSTAEVSSNKNWKEPLKSSTQEQFINNSVTVK